MANFWELSADGENSGLREPTALENLVIQQLYRFFESGAIKIMPAEAKIGEKTAFLLIPDDAGRIIAAVGKLVRSEAKKASRHDFSGGRYRIISKTCNHCGHKYHARVVLTDMICRHCGEPGGFAREAGQRQALLLCAACGQDFLYSFDIEGDREAHYKADVDADIDRRAKALRQFVESYDKNQAWRVPKRIPPKNIRPN